MDVNKLLCALENYDNESIMNLTTKKIMEMNLKILKELQLDKLLTLDYLKKLKGYKYIDEINELKYGSFVRWIPISDPNYLPLHHCGIICEIKIIDDGVLITSKNFMHRHYTFKLDECLIFQKLTSQEQIIINALDHLEKSKDKEGEDGEEEEEGEEGEQEGEEEDE